MILIILVASVFVLAAYYPIRYAAVRPWRSGNDVGRAAFTWSTIVAVVMGLTFGRVLGWVPPDWVRVVVYLGIMGGLIYQDVTLHRALRSGKARRKGEYQHEPENGNGAAQSVR